jgi:PAS domain S-box-containing protein
LLDNRRRRLTLRCHLVLLVAVAVVPVVLFAAWTVLDMGKQQQRSVEGGLVTTVRALATAVEREIATSVRSLEVLATSDALTRDDLRAFHAHAERVLGINDVWYIVGLTDTRGQVAVSTARPFGWPLPWIGDRDYIQRVIASGRPVVSDVIDGRTTGQANIAVAVPVMRDGRLRYVLVAGISPQALERIISAQKIPADWISGVADRNQVLIARNRDSEQFTGRELIAPLRRAARAATAGTGRFPVADGPDVYAAWQHTPSLGWTVTLGVPVTTVDIALRRSMWKMVVVGVALAAAGAGLALAWGRRISRAMSALSAAAGALGRGEVPDTLPSRVAEVEAIGRAMKEAGATITERTLQVRASQRQLRRLVDSSPIGIVVGNGDRILDANAAFLRMTGCSPDELRRSGLGWRALIPLESTASRSEIEAVRPDGTRVPILLSSVFLDEIRQQWASFVLDLTDLRRAEAEVRGQREALAHALRVSTLGELVASLSHELSQPLTAIIANAQAARRCGDDVPGRAGVDVREALDDIVDDGQRAVAIIRRLRALFRKDAAEHTSIDINELVTEVVELVSSDAARRGARIELALADALPSVSGDRVQLQQVVLNLLVNALQSMATVEPPRTVTLTTTGEPGRVAITVGDRGVGVDADSVATIFEPFVSTKPDGLGMGLAISRSIVLAHGGRIWATSNADRGLTVHVDLPSQGRSATAPLGPAASHCGAAVRM